MGPEPCVDLDVDIDVNVNLNATVEIDVVRMVRGPRLRRQHR